MPLIASWNRPSTWMLAVVLAANLALPLAHFWPSGEVAGAETTLEEPVAARVRGNSAQSAPSVTAASAENRPMASPGIEPFHPALRARRAGLQGSAAICLAWGPFAQSSEAESLASELDLDGASFEVLETEVPVSPEYLVTVRTPAPRAVEEKVMAELARRRVDSYVLDRGPAGSVLSVGVFSAPDRAQSQRRLMTELGLDADVEPLGRSRQVYHLLARVPADRDLVPAPAGACDDIAPIKQFL